MEEWQKTHITQNLPELISLTEFNTDVKAELLANDILSQNEGRDAKSFRKGKTKASYNYYQLLMTRNNAYIVLTRALEKNKQTGAVKILINGIRNFGIPKELDDFKHMEIEVNGKRVKSQELFPVKKLKLVQEIFQDMMSALEFYDLFVKKGKIFVLATCTIPPEPPFYIPRFISNRIEIDESFFKEDCPDVFVFKRSIERYKLSEIARPHFTDTSTSQLTKMTSRFIHLDEIEDWDELRKSAKVPIHLINYESGRNIYILEGTSAGSDFLIKVGSKKERVYMSENEFIFQQLSKDLNASSVCICDTPGMGKTFLLANIANLMSKQCPGTIFAYIQISTLVAEFFMPSMNTSREQNAAYLNVLKYVSPSKEHTNLLVKLLKAELIRIEIFLDGFDEVPLDKVEWLKQVFWSITTTFPTARIYITSRPHMRHELEKSLGVIAYDILPFNLQNQVDFLVQYWQKNEPVSNQFSLQTYATTCLKIVKESLSTTDKEITGIPLLCQLIADIYADKVSCHSAKRRKLPDVSLKISGMYQTFIERKINHSTKNKAEFDQIKLVHVWHALKLLFPTNQFHEDQHFNSVTDLLESPKIVKIGILQKHSNATLEFIHRTFAEYLVAEYFSTILKNGKMQMTDELYFNSIPVLKLLLKCQEISWRMYNFPHPVIVAFLNYALAEVNISEDLIGQTTPFVSSILPTDIITILCACCQHNLSNIFSLLRQVLKKCTNPSILKSFTNENCYKLLKVCISESTSQLWLDCIQLLTEDLKLDITQYVTVGKLNTLLQTAVECANYIAVEYFVDRVSLNNKRVLVKCVSSLYYKDDIEKREEILQLLLNKDPDLILETPKILVNPYKHVDVRLFKVLVKFKNIQTVVNKDGDNCAIHALSCMSPSNYHELVEFLLKECKADYLFVDNKKWSGQLSKIIQRATILPETLDLLLNIPGNDINMEDTDGENLLFSAVAGNQMDNLKQLVDRGLDYNARGSGNRSLLHLAAWNGGVEMVRYLFSLELDPNCRDVNEWTPLHVAAYYDRLSVVEVLLETGAIVQAKNNKGQTALHVSAAIKHQSIEVIELLIGKGIGVNDCDNDGNTPLHLCTDSYVSYFLVEMGADSNAKNQKGQAPTQMKSDLSTSSSSDSDTKSNSESGTKQNSGSDTKYNSDSDTKYNSGSDTAD